MRPVCSVRRLPSSGMGQECNMAAADESGNTRVSQSAQSGLSGPGDRMASDVDPSKLERLRKAAQRIRADLEARRAGSASIDTAFEAVKRDAQSGEACWRRQLPFASSCSSCRMPW